MNGNIKWNSTALCYSVTLQWTYTDVNTDNIQSYYIDYFERYTSNNEVDYSSYKYWGTFYKVANLLFIPCVLPTDYSVKSSFRVSN